METLVQLVIKDSQDPLEPLVNLDLLDPMVLLDNPDWLDPPELQAQMEVLVLLDQLVLKDLKEELDLQAFLVLPGQMDNRVLQDKMGLLEPQGRQDFREAQELQDQQEE
jgi:hypothetical protein